MSYTEKMDVLDLIINILREHEETLDALVERLEAVTDIIQGSSPQGVPCEDSPEDLIPEHEKEKWK